MIIRDFEELAEKKVEMVMCEFCSETYDRRKTLQHNYTNHFEIWEDAAKVDFFYSDKDSQAMQKKYAGTESNEHQRLLNYLSPIQILMYLKPWIGDYKLEPLSVVRRPFFNV